MQHHFNLSKALSGRIRQRSACRIPAESSRHVHGTPATLYTLMGWFLQYDHKSKEVTVLLKESAAHKPEVQKVERTASGSVHRETLAAGAAIGGMSCTSWTEGVGAQMQQLSRWQTVE